MDLKSLAIGMLVKPFASALTSKATVEVWDKGKEIVKKSKEPALPFVGIIKGIDKKY